MWNSLVVTFDGKAVPCCFDKDATHKFGNLNEQSFPEIWSNNQYNNFRKTLFTNRKSIDICKNCTEGLKV